MESVDLAVETFLSAREFLDAFQPERRKMQAARDKIHSMMALQPGNLTPEKFQSLLNG